MKRGEQADLSHTSLHLPKGTFLHDNGHNMYIKNIYETIPLAHVYVLFIYVCCETVNFKLSKICIKIVFVFF